MTTAPTRGSQRIMSNSEREVDRLQSLVGVLEAGIPRCASLWYVIDQSNFYVTCVNLTYTGLQASGKKLTCVCTCAARDRVIVLQSVSQSVSGHKNEHFERIRNACGFLSQRMSSKLKIIT